MNNQNECLNEKEFEAIANSRAVRQNIVRESHLMFFHIYFHHYVTYPIAEFHKEMFRITQNKTNKIACIIAFRGSGKSTIMTLSYPLWAILGVQQKKFILLISQTQAQTRQHMINLKHELESNELLRKDLGPFQEDYDDTEWATSSLVFKNTGARITMASVDQSIRGMRHRQHRPDLIILDDVEDVNSVRTYQSRTKISDWFSREIVPLGDVNTRIIIVGNLLHEDSLVMRLKQKIEREELTGIYREFPLINENNICLWPEKFNSQEKIDELKQKVVNDIAWSMEYLLIPISDSSCVIDHKWIKYYEKLPTKNEGNEYKYTRIGVDLAVSQKDSADYTTMVVAHAFGYGEDLNVYIEPDPINKHLDFSTIIETIKLVSTHFVHKNHDAHVYIENNGFQDILVEMIKKKYPSLSIEGITAQADKRARLAFISTLVKSGRVLFPEKGCEELIAQITGFGRERHDDLADAFSLVLGRIMKENRNKINWDIPKIPHQELQIPNIQYHGMIF